MTSSSLATQALQASYTVQLQTHQAPSQRVHVCEHLQACICIERHALTIWSLSKLLHKTECWCLELILLLATTCLHAGCQEIGRQAAP